MFAWGDGAGQPSHPTAAAEPCCLQKPANPVPLATNRENRYNCQKDIAATGYHGFEQASAAGRDKAPNMSPFSPVQRVRWVLQTVRCRGKPWTERP